MELVERPLQQLEMTWGKPGAVGIGSRSPAAHLHGQTLLTMEPWCGCHQTTECTRSPKSSRWAQLEDAELLERGPGALEEEEPAMDGVGGASAKGSVAGPIPKVTGNAGADWS